MRCGLLGETLGHSFSKEIHERLGRYPYELFEVAPARLDAFLTARDFDGLNVTIPYKQAVIPYLDGMSERAAAVGAVNTVVNRGGRLWGDNTDFGGMQALVRRMGLDLRGATVLIAGSGGTSRTAAAVAGALGAARCVRMSRSGRDGALPYETAYERYPDADFLIQTTPAGMYPDVDGCAVDLTRLPKLRGVADAVYNPLATRLVRAARARAIPAEGGLFMLTSQAVASAEAFTGARFGADTAERIYREFLFEKRSIVLIGMPGSGKSTLGALLAKRLGRELVSTDALIVQRAGMPIPALFRTRGEACFRALETQALRDVCRTGGKVVDTGGGAPLRPENVDLMQQNGVVVFLDRAPEELRPSPERPLADSGEKLQKLYRERYPIYAAAADVTVPVRAQTPEETANMVLERLR